MLSRRDLATKLRVASLSKPKLSFYKILESNGMLMISAFQALACVKAKIEPVYKSPSGNYLRRASLPEASLMIYARSAINFHARLKLSRSHAATVQRSYKMHGTAYRAFLCLARNKIPLFLDSAEISHVGTRELVLSLSSFGLINYINFIGHDRAREHTGAHFFSLREIGPATGIRFGNLSHPSLTRTARCSQGVQWSYKVLPLRA